MTKIRPYVILAAVMSMTLQGAYAQVPTTPAEALEALIQLFVEKVNDAQLNQKIQGAIDQSKAGLISVMDEGDRVLIELPIRKDPAGFKYLEHIRIRGTGKDDLIILCKSMLTASIGPSPRFPNILLDNKSSYYVSYERFGNTFIERKTEFPFNLTLTKQARDKATTGSCD